MVSGGILGIGGAITMVAGNLKAQSAEDVEGCTREGLFTVTCRDQQSTDQAQDRIDSGKQIAVVGLVAALVGGRRL
ncbi:MAG: hypothetical protein IPN90_07070 [Elusimicrobia bacterium]|nr:hypothetical protein [Elusimicrobiota bacterium]